jgi:hypothetical protein
MSKHKSILSSLTALGASELPVTTNSVPRNGVLASVAAAGVSLLACQSGEAGTISVFTPNVNVGFAAGDINDFKLVIPSLNGSGFSLERTTNGPHSLFFNSISGNATSVQVRTASDPFAGRGTYGKKFSQIGAGASDLSVVLASRSADDAGKGSAFSQEYYAFSFEDTSSQTHYGWTYGTLTGGYSNLTYNLISWAYDTTPDEQIGMGFTGSSTPEPCTAALGAMAALILGAAGVREWNKARA